MRHVVAIIVLFSLTSCLDYVSKGWNRYQEETGGPEGLVELVGDNAVKGEKLARWRYAAEGGDAEAQYQMGKAHCCGKRPYYNTYRALKWYCKAAKQGQRDAMMEVGKIYVNAHEEEGSVIPRDKALAYTYFIKSVEHGSEKAKEWRDKTLGDISLSERKKAKKLLNEWPDIQCQIH